MPEEAINPLRLRMIEDMTIRNFDPRTQQTYIRSVRSCCRYCDRAPTELTFEDVRRYQLHLTQSGLAPASINGAMVALRFLFRVTLKRPEAVDYIAIVREPQRLPLVLTQDEVARLLEAAPGLKWRTALSVAYGTGLRASEVVGLKIGDIDSQRMRIRVEQGKGRHDRDALLSPHLLATLRLAFAACASCARVSRRRNAGGPAERGAKGAGACGKRITFVQSAAPSGKIAELGKRRFLADRSEPRSDDQNRRSRDGRDPRGGRRTARLWDRG